MPELDKIEFNKNLEITNNFCENYIEKFCHIVQACKKFLRSKNLTDLVPIIELFEEYVFFFHFMIKI